MSNSVPVLLYHRIDQSGDPIATSPEIFRRHLRWLKERGWSTIDLNEFSEVVSSGMPFEERSFVITFDDGYESLASTAAPILEEFGYTAVCFAATRFIGKPKEPNPDPLSAKDAALFLTWDQVRNLQSRGVIEFQSHTHTHQDFSECSQQELQHELTHSRHLLSTELGLPPSYFKHLAWPWGRSTQEWRALARRAGYKFQYTVSRLSYQHGDALDEIPRTCFDATTFEHFQRQFSLQSGYLSFAWNIAYPCARKLRQLVL